MKVTRYHTDEGTVKRLRGVYLQNEVRDSVRVKEVSWKQKPSKLNEVVEHPILTLLNKNIATPVFCSCTSQVHATLKMMLCHAWAAEV